MLRVAALAGERESVLEKEGVMVVEVRLFPDVPRTYLIGEVKDALHRRSAVDGGVVLGEKGDDLLVGVETPADGLQIRLIVLVQRHATG